jgi:hypothetical protein
MTSALEFGCDVTSSTPVIVFALEGRLTSDSRF